MERLLHVGQPNIGDQGSFLSKVKEILERKWLTNGGPTVLEFENTLSEYLGVKHCIATCNGTIALELAIRALGLTGEVVLPSFTFIATAHALQWQGITPVFCDIDPETYCIDANRIQSLITPETTGIIGVHLYGHPCNIEKLSEVAQANGLKLLFDAAHAFGCGYQGQKIGAFGECEVFSFHATKFFNSFEGGAIATNNDQLADKLRLMQNFGFEKIDSVIHIGTNGKMTEICAAMGLVNFESLSVFLERNQINYEYYQNGISAIPGLKMMSYDDSESNNFQYIVVEVRPDYPLSRDQLIQLLHQNRVRARRYFWPGCHRMEPYRTLYPNTGRSLEISEAVADTIILFPTGYNIGEPDIDRVLKLLKRPHAKHTD